MYYHYIILKKNDEYLAVLTNPNTQWELGHYYDQGFAFVMEMRAFNATSAIEIAKQNENSEIVKLRAELDSLRQEHQKILNENYNLKSNNGFGFSVGNNINPLDVLGFSTHPDKDTLRSRYKTFSQKFHPDKDGSNFLMQLINSAYEQLNKMP